MKIFWITPETPYPPNTGGKIGIWKRIEYLSRTNEIYLYSIKESEADEKERSKMEQYCAKAALFKRKQKLVALFEGVFYPYPAVSRWNRKMKQELLKDYERILPDYIMVDSPQMIGVLPDNIIHEGRVILNQHNLEYQTLDCIAQNFKGPRKFLYHFVSRQMEEYEKKIYLNRNICLYTFVSQKDKECFEKQYKDRNTELVPVGAELHKNVEANANANKNMIFVGKMSYFPNEQGAIWLIDEVMPIIAKQIPDVVLYIVGKNPTNSLLKRVTGRKNIVITGAVESIEPYYDNCELSLVPIMSGGGVNVKLVEAMGYGKMVVSTSKGVEGTEFIRNTHLRVEDDASSFAEACVEYLRHPNSKENMDIRNNGYQLVENNYSWATVVGKLERRMLEMLDQ